MPIIFNQRTLSAITQTIKNGNLLIGILTANEYLQMEDPLRLALVRLVHQEKPTPSKILQMALDGLLAKDLPEGWQLDAQLYNRKRKFTKNFSPWRRAASTTFRKFSLIR